MKVIKIFLKKKKKKRENKVANNKEIFLIKKKKMVGNNKEIFLETKNKSQLSIEENVTRLCKLPVCKSPMWQICHHELFNKGWFDQAGTRAQLMCEITKNYLVRNQGDEIGVGGKQTPNLLYID